MILGQSIFDAVMMRLKEEREEPAPSDLRNDGVSWSGVKGLNAGFVGAGHEDDGVAVAERLDAAYFDFTLEPPEVGPADTQAFGRLTPQEIAAEMALSGTDTAAVLNGKRRDFARRNHPDLVPEEWREKATLRMKIANLLIDEALRQAEKQGG